MFNFFKSGGTLRNRGMRPSPKESATLYNVGFRKMGQDGYIYQVVMASNGVKRWQKVPTDMLSKPLVKKPINTAMKTAIKKPTMPKRTAMAKPVTAAKPRVATKSITASKPRVAAKPITIKPSLGKKLISFKPSAALATVDFTPSVSLGKTTASKKKKATAKRSKLSWKLDRIYASKQKHEQAYKPKRKKPAKKHGKQK